MGSGVFSVSHGCAVMSSHDSVSMVFKCMLKGAADFLIKPLRRNELRNLWQHVWRRHAVCYILQSFSNNILIYLVFYWGLPKLTYIYLTFFFFQF